MRNSTFKWSQSLTNTSLEKLELNTFDRYGDFEELNRKRISRLLIDSEGTTILPSIFQVCDFFRFYQNSGFSGKSFKLFIVQIRVKVM